MSHKKQVGKGNKYKSLNKNQRIKKEKKRERKEEARIFRSGYKTNNILEIHGNSMDQSC